MRERKSHRALSQAGVAQGLAIAGVTALLVGGMLYDLASRHLYLSPFDALSSFVPAIATSICCLGLFSRRRLLGTTALATLSVIGSLVMWTQTGWGNFITDAAPEQATSYAQRTYAGDVLYCFGFGIQLTASILMAASFLFGRGVDPLSTRDSEAGIGG